LEEEAKGVGETEKEVKIKLLGNYNGHNIKSNKSIDLNLKMPYDELTNYIQLVQLLNENITVYFKIGKEKPKKIGLFMIKDLKIDGDGEGKLKLNSLLDYVEISSVNNLATNTEEILKFLFVAKIGG
jgi:hypothetical protein